MTAAFQAGGFVREEMLYIERPADLELFDALRRGEFCYVLAPRQIGKTSLAVRTRKKLSDAGTRCVAVDLNEIGSHGSAEQWFYSLLRSVAEGLDLEDQVEPFWEANAKESLTARWTRFCRTVVLEQVKAPVVIFLDEIDSILSVANVADDFFASIRAMHEKRAEVPELARLSFCLLGVASPRDLMKDQARTPFNIGRAVHLEDFTSAEAERLLPGLAGRGHEPRALLEAILAWTDGHPYMSLKVANALAEEGVGADGGGSAAGRVDESVRRLFLDSGRQEEPNLRYAEDRFSRVKRDGQVPKMLRLYRRLLAGEPVTAVGSDPVQQEFRLTGMVAERREGAERWLRVRNRIFATVFNEAWVRAKEADRIIAAPLDTWLAGGRSRDLLLRGALLEQAQQWARSRDDLTREEREFLEASRELAAQARTRRVFIGILALVALALGVFLVLLVQKNQEAVAARKGAEQSEARSREASVSLMQSTARLSAALGQQQDAGADAIEAALSTLIIAKQLQAPIPPDAFLGITRAISALAYSTPLLGHEGIVRTAVFSPDGSHILTSSNDRTARLWNSRSGQLLATLQGHVGTVNSAAFSPDGARVLTASDDRTARLWNSRSGQLLATLQGHVGTVESALFSPDGARVVTASFDGTARLWDSRSGLLLATLKAHKAMTISATFSPDGSRILTTSYISSPRLWDSRSGQLLATLKEDESIVGSAVFSPDGSRVLAISKDDRTARVWDSRSGQLLATLNGHEDVVISAAFSPDGSRVVTASYDKTARLWDSRSGQLLATLQGHEDGVSSAAFSPDGSRVVTASYDRTARLWNIRPDHLQATLQGHEDSINNAAFSPDGLRVVTSSDDRTARLWDSRSGQLLTTLQEHEGSVSSAVFSLDGSRVLTTSNNDRTARLWDGRSGQLLAAFKANKTKDVSATFSPDGLRVVTASDDKTACLWDSRSGQLLTTLQGHKDGVISAAFSPDSSRVVTASADTTARLWDSHSGQLLATLKGHEGSVRSAAFSPDGLSISTTGYDSAARLWDSRSGRLLATLKGHKEWVRSATFSPDGSLLLTTSGDTTARLWSSRSGKLLATFRGHEAIVSSAGFSPDGSRIVTASGDGITHLWDSHSGQPLATLKGRKANILSAVFSPDSSRVLTTSDDNITRLWIASPEGWLIEACNLPQFNPSSAEIRAFCQPYKGRSP